MTSQQLVFFRIQIYSFEFLTTHILLLLSLITLISVDGTMADCMFFVPNNIVCTKLLNILLQTFITSSVTNAMDETRSLWRTLI